MKTCWILIFFLSELVYLCEIFEKMNEFNISLQEHNWHILKVAEKVSAFRKMLLLWRIKIN
jgi:hypothetical protein